MLTVEESTTSNNNSGQRRPNSGQSGYKNGRQPNKQQLSKRGKIKVMFKDAKNMERLGRWNKAAEILRHILRIDPRDSYSHLALARLESRRENSRRMKNSIKDRHAKSNNDTISETNSAVCHESDNMARQVFEKGTQMCPDSVHLWQAWALYEQELGHRGRATELFEKALSLDDSNPYVCHAFGLMEQRGGNLDHAQELWERALTANEHSTAALVCSLGELYASSKKPSMARDLYARHVLRLTSERERTEVYLAAAWLEERHFRNLDNAADLIQQALALSPSNGRAHVALVRLEGRRSNNASQNSKNSGIKGKRGKKNANKNNPTSSSDAGMKKRLAELCTQEELEDGRLFNAWASMEVKAGRFSKAMEILKTGMKRFPLDQTLVQAAGKVAERIGDYTASRDYYSASLRIQPSAPALVAFAMLELRHPDENAPVANHTVRRLFEEALLLDPRHGPAYNAYGNMERRKGNIEEARIVFERGVQRNCTDPASVYHGYAKLELTLGNVDKARSILIRGLQQVERQEGMMVTMSSQRERAVFLAHTLGMLELNSQRVAQAKKVFAHGIQRHASESSQLLLGAALCEVGLGDENAARRLFEQAVNADRKHAHAWQAWGVMEMRAGNTTVATTLFECGIKSAPRHGALWQAFATMESRMGNFDTARALFAAGIEKCPKHVPLYQAWACLELRGGNFIQAKKLITEALTRDKRQGSGWLVAAKIEEKLGNEGLSRLLLRRGLAYSPNNAEMYCALSNLEVGRGRIDEARVLLEKGLDADPLHAPLYHSLAELEARVFNIDGLAKLNKRAAKIFNSNALVPPPSSSHAWAKKIRMGRTKLPGGVAALAEEVGIDEIDLDADGKFTGVDPTSLLESMNYEHDVLGEMFSSGNDADEVKS